MVGHANILTGGGFESGQAGWRPLWTCEANAGSLALDTGTVHSSKRSGQVGTSRPKGLEPGSRIPAMPLWPCWTGDGQRSDQALVRSEAVLADAASEGNQLRIRWRTDTAGDQTSESFNRGPRAGWPGSPSPHDTLVEQGVADEAPDICLAGVPARQGQRNRPRCRGSACALFREHDEPGTLPRP